MRQPTTGPRTRRGHALIISLLILLLLSVLGITAARVSTMQERMSGNFGDRERAFQAAERALREAEAFLASGGAPPLMPNANGLYQSDAPNRPQWLKPPLTPGNGAFEYGGRIDGVARQPDYFIEQLPPLIMPGQQSQAGVPMPKTMHYRITARGFGGREETIVILGSLYQQL